MTGEEAINILHGMRAENLNLDNIYIKRRYYALTMAIKALERSNVIQEQPLNNNTTVSSY